MGLTFAELTDSPLGPISMMAGDFGLEEIAFSSLKVFKEQHTLQVKEPSLEGLEIVGALLAELNEYLFGIRKTFSVAVDWKSMGHFQKQVLTLTASIPYGQVWTYGEIARRLGKPGAARAVGRALGDNPVPIVIPCHRVVGSDGRLRGYAGGLDRKAFLLNLEGLQLDGHKII